MVQRISEVIRGYEKRLQGMPFVPKSSYGRAILREDGGPNKIFLTHLFCDQAIAIQFLKDMGLIPIKVQCNTCGRDMTWSAQPNIPEGFRWRYRRKVDGVKCSESRSIKHGSWFQQSNLTFQEILYLTYDIVGREPANQIQHEHRFSPNTVADWRMFCRENMLVFLEG
jgi:hypothetical protein